MGKMLMTIGLKLKVGGNGGNHALMPSNVSTAKLLIAFCIINFNCAIGVVASTATTARTTTMRVTSVVTTVTTSPFMAQAPTTAHSANDGVLGQNINQNLIMSPTVMAKVTSGKSNDDSGLTREREEAKAGAGAGAAVPTAAALTSHSVPLAYPPPGTITATSTLYQKQTLGGGSGSSGSSITSFDSTNLIDDRREKQHRHQQHQQQQQQQQQQPYQQSSASGSRIQAKDTADELHTMPMHRPMQENHLDGGGGGGGNGGAGEGADDVFSTPMYFGTENSTVVTTQIGATAHVPCSVHHIGDGVVSWIRKKDYHLLTVGLTTYSSDERFSATHLKHSEDWTLQIKFVQLRDAGVYECQVSTHPPTSIFLHLNVVEARAEISGPPIRYLTPGSTLRLQCRVVQNTEASEYIFWYHDNRMINYDIDRGINVSTEPDFQSSELTILRTRREHSGNFTCVASNTQPASVLVHIFKGDNPAAMYHGHVGASTKAYQTQLHNILAMIAIGYRILHSYLLHMKIL